MNFHRHFVIFFIIILTPELAWGQIAVEGIPTMESPSTILKPTLFNQLSSYLIVLSLGAIVLASGIWYKVYHKKYQHPYLFLEEAENSSALAVEEGDIVKAIEILTNALHTIENDPKSFNKNGKDRKETIWFLKRKLQELDCQLAEENINNS